MHLIVSVTFTAVSSTVGALYWSISPINKAITATGFGCATGTLFSGTVASLNTTTVGVGLGISFASTTGTPTITVPLVNSLLTNLG